MIAWIDLETTGLNPKRDAILEVACVVTNDELREVARFERVLYHGDANRCAQQAEGDLDRLAGLTGIDRVVIDMHRKNELWLASRKSILGAREVEYDLVDFLRRYAGERPQLGGSSVHFDRSFLAEHMPRVVEVLHHRQVDVSTVNELARRFWPAVHQGRPSEVAGAGPAHRAMPDILLSIETARYYAARLGPMLAPASDAAFSQQIARWLWEGPARSQDEIITGILRGDWRAPVPEAL